MSVILWPRVWLPHFAMHRIEYADHRRASPKIHNMIRMGSRCMSMGNYRMRTGRSQQSMRLRSNISYSYDFVGFFSLVSFGFWFMCSPSWVWFSNVHASAQPELSFANVRWNDTWRRWRWRPMCISPETIFSYKIVYDYIRCTRAFSRRASHTSFGRILFSTQWNVHSNCSHASTFEAAKVMYILLFRNVFSFICASNVWTGEQAKFRKSIEIDAIKRNAFECIRRMFAGNSIL